ncbi:DUF58 domain-containing protein [Microbacterium sp. NEAU-LLC]|uniref:DUF58 domain-containing protein n=1 Tax=Microbacterium helvum TaxID=2773713 RepID=A0ABR8NLJ3_9MICO|nr:DUF58 domain-containing protein [Microbacterium helvum]MBD3940798.1 DUF58 domain-containing protein [Microbacterium helvum]
MTDGVRTTTETPVRWHRTPVVALGLAGAVLLAAAGIAFSRPDLVAVGLPLGLATAWALARRPAAGILRLTVAARSGSDDPQDGVVVGEVDAALTADWVQLAVDQGGLRTGLADTEPGDARLRSQSLLRHTGPSELIAVTARGVDQDGAWVSTIGPRTALTWNAVPDTVALRQLPVALRLTGLHGGHEGARPGQGGDFRDIHPFAPGDELRRVDWRATARLARRPGDLLVRRTQALSDSTVVIAIDTVDDLGEAVATWGTDDPEHSGVTSLDLARQAALSIATSAVQAGDRVAYHVLAPGGRTVRAGAGARQLARLRDVIAATGASDVDVRYRRAPVIAHGSIVFVLSTFFDGAAAELATHWRAAGHAVVAVDILPSPHAERLSREQLLATRTLLAEREEVFAELRATGIDVVPWAGDSPDIALRVAARGQQRRRAVRR